MRMCPNLSNPQIKQEFDELVSVLGENTAYYVWNENNGYGLDYAPNGAQSKLFQDLFNYYKDRNKAIEVKSKTLSKEFKQWFQGSKVIDNNEEPLIVYHGGPKGIEQFVNPKDLSRKYAGLHSTVLNRNNQMGIYFIDKKKIAEQYADAYRKDKQIYPVFICAKNIQNIKQIQFYGLQFLKNINKLFDRNYINYQDITQQDVEKLKDKGIDGLSTDSWSNSIEFVVFNSNQIKSIDNNSQFSLTDDNIYYYVKDNIKSSSIVSYYSGKQGIGKLFTGKNQSAKQVLTNLINNSFITEQQYVLAQSILGNIEDSVEVELVNSTDYFMAYQNGKIYINIDGFNSYSNYDVANAFLHELLHYFTVNKYANDKQFRNRIDSLFNKISEQFPESEYKRTGLYYGLTNPQEFISELYVNKAFRDAILKKNMSLWRRLLYTILNALKLVKLANKLQPNDIYQVYNSITDAINNRTLDPDLDNCGEIFYYKADINLNYLEYEADNIIRKAMNGLRASEKALKNRDKNPVFITKLQQQIEEFNNLLQKGEDQKILIKFIENSSTQFEKVLNTIRKGIIAVNYLSNEQLKNFKNDFLDFYGPVTEEINQKLFFQGYFNNLPAKDLSYISEQLTLINKAYQEIQGKYNFILKNKVINLFKYYGDLYNFPTDDIESFINDKLNNTPEDMNRFLRYLQFMSNSKDTGLRIVNRIISDINSEIQFFANTKTQDIIRQFSKITTKEQLLYFELDENGKPTGYLVRPLNYGKFKQDLNNFLTQLDAKYNVVDKNYYLLDDTSFLNYTREKEEWLEQHCERKFTNKYYKEYNKLSAIAREKAKSLNKQITAIIESVTDSEGVHLERLDDRDWNKLDNLYSLKRNLSNDYYLDGSKKQGEDLQIAKEFQNFYKGIGDNKIKSKKISQEEINKLITQKKKELSTELFDKWFKRNISIQYTDEFVDSLKSSEKINFKEDQEEYDRLYEERRQLLQIGKDNNSSINISNKYNTSVKERILELDAYLQALREKHRTGNSDFFEIADIKPTAYYQLDKEAARKKGDDYYQEWFYKNHYFTKKGIPRPASYYTILVPKQQKFYEYRLSRMNQELDKNSDLINPNYNFEDPEYYQPKKELYDNSKAYEAATKTDSQQQVYNYIVNTLDEANSKLNFLSKRDNYKLPQATGDFIDFTMRNGNFFKNFGKMIKDSIVAKDDDPEFALNNSVTKADGSQLDLIPTHYIQMLEHPENISRNLVGLLAEYSRMAENYRLKNQHSADLEIIQDAYDIRRYANLSSKGQITSYIEGKESNTGQKLREFLDIQLYGRTMKPWNITIPFTNKKISITKLMTNLRNYASASNLGNNFLSIIKSIVQGFDKAFVEGFAGQFYTMSDISKSMLRQLYRMPKRMLNLGNQLQNDLGFALLEHNGIAHSIDEKFKGLQYKRGFRLLYKYLIWGGWQAADFMVKLPIVESVYANMKYVPEQNKFMSFPQYEKLYPGLSLKEKRKMFNNLNTITMLDIITVKDGKIIIKPEYSEYMQQAFDKNVQYSVRNICNTLCSKIDGQLRQEDKLTIFQNAIGAAIGMHRSFFIVNANEALLKNYQYNPIIDDFDEARYSSGFRGIIKWIINLYNEVRYLNNSIKREQLKKSLSNIEIYNSKRILMQLSIIGMLYLLVAIWLKPQADDDKDDQLLQSTGYILDSVRFEELSEYNPLDIVNQIKNVSPAISPFENMLNLVNPFKFSKNYSTEKIKSGYYKDMEKWQKTLIKATPGLRGVWESQDARTKWQYLQSQLDK